MRILDRLDRIDEWLRDPPPVRLPLHVALKVPQSQWHKNRWKRRWNRWNRKFLGIRPSHIAQFGVGWGLGSVIFPLIMSRPMYWDLWDTGVVGAAAIGALGWKVAAEKANRQKRKWRAREIRRLKRITKRIRREMEEMASQHPDPTRERRNT